MTGSVRRPHRDDPHPRGLDGGGLAVLVSPACSGGAPEPDGTVPVTATTDASPAASTPLPEEGDVEDVLAAGELEGQVVLLTCSDGELVQLDTDPRCD